MKKNGKLVLIIAVIVLVLVVLGFKFSLIGNVVVEPTATVGPSQEEQVCMRACVAVGCETNDQACKESNGDKCMKQCNLVKPEQTPEEACVETCVEQGCDKYDFSCQNKNKEKCDKECGMIKEPEAKSEEEQCIRDCVNKIEPGLICQAGEGGEKGNEICQKCAKECEHLYAGPCLNEEKLEQKKTECQTCEHCYGEPIMGDSGEGYDCIVDVECKDASSEFGDEPGTGEGVPLTERIADAVGNVVKEITDFFQNLFGGRETEPVGNSESGSN